MNPGPPLVFRSSGRRGYSAQIRADQRCVRARKHERELEVVFTPAACSVQTSEGLVHAKAGDAILTGVGGERWRVSREHFHQKYRPVPPTRAGETGRYVSLPYQILALPMTQAFKVLLADGKSQLSGHAGDWLVDYGDGSLGIVSRTIFPTTYQIISEKTPLALHQLVERLLLIGVRLESLPAAPAPPPPRALQSLIEATADSHRRFDERAIYFGHRYRSGFWAIYLLSAIAVLCAIMPLALGWDSASHSLHPYAGVWAVGEVALIGTVSAIYWLGHRRDWQGQWLHARTTAELSWYLPLVAPLLDFTAPSAEANWYVRVFDPGQHLRGADDVSALCAQTEPLARKLLSTAWADPKFIGGYARWTIDILEQQRRYHHRVAAKQHALLHRVHRVTTTLFALTAFGALAHLAVHTLWLSLVTTFFPALGASLHGALAQSEAYRLGATSERLVNELRGAIARIESNSLESNSSGDVGALKSSIEAAIALILEEHQDWHLLVRPHHLPLA